MYEKILRPITAAEIIINNISFIVPVFESLKCILFDKSIG